MKKDNKEEKFIKQPYYEGGDKQMKEFISKHLIYPPISQQQKLEGDVHIKYDINYKGEVIDAKVIGGIDQYCDNEAIRVVKMLRFIVPKIPRHLKVTFHKTITVHFRLNEVEVSSSEKEEPIHHPDIHMVYTAKLNTTENKVEKNTPIMYQYTIKI